MLGWKMIGSPIALEHTLNLDFRIRESLSNLLTWADVFSYAGCNVMGTLWSSTPSG
jgi:hypothetical protein